MPVQLTRIDQTLKARSGAWSNPVIFGHVLTLFVLASCKHPPNFNSGSAGKTQPQAALIQGISGVIVDYLTETTEMRDRGELNEGWTLQVPFEVTDVDRAEIAISTYITERQVDGASRLFLPSRGEPFWSGVIEADGVFFRFRSQGMEDENLVLVFVEKGTNTVFYRRLGYRYS